VKLLVVEDSERLRHSLGEGMKRSGFVVDLAADGTSGAHLAQVNDYDVVVLDIMLPGQDGLSVLREIRERGDDVQILMLTAMDRVEDRVKGLELGADDYLVKPFAFEELVARIKTLCRRRHHARNPQLSIGEVTIDTARREVSVNENVVALTPTEYSVLEYLFMRRGRVVEKSQLLEWLNDSDTQVVSNVVEVMISNLRKKLRENGASDVIGTKRGFGYYVDC